MACRMNDSQPGPSKNNVQYRENTNNDDARKSRPQVQINAVTAEMKSAQFSMMSGNATYQMELSDLPGNCCWWRVYADACDLVGLFYS
jgi:hypothetical protein